VDALIADIHQLKPVNRFGRPIGVVLNEHARWTDPANRAKWQLSWSLQGAISTGDFLLRTMARPEVSAANYWCYIHKGPWRVLDRDWSNPDSAPFATAIHHLYKVLNDSLGARYELLTPEPAEADTGGKYAYDVTAGLFTDPATGGRSLVAVNRSTEKAALIKLKDLPSPTNATARRLLITAPALDSANIPASPDAVTLEETTPSITRDEKGALQFELPPQSVAAWSWR
jgi:alpha-N-arabinofuranosidase